MHNLLKLSATALFAFGLSTIGNATPDVPSDTTLLVEVGGEVVGQADIGHMPTFEANVLEAAQNSEERTCAPDQAPLDLVLEVDGEQTATVHSCMDESMTKADVLTEETTGQAASVFCNVCNQTNDCFACCKCAGGSTPECGLIC